MARDWDKIKDKLGAQADGPATADWEAMQAKIAAQPSLVAKQTRPIWITAFLAGSLGLLLGIGAWFFLPWEAGTITNEIPKMDLLKTPNEISGVQAQESLQTKPEEKVYPTTPVNALGSMEVSEQEENVSSEPSATKGISIKPQKEKAEKVAIETIAAANQMSQDRTTTEDQGQAKESIPQAPKQNRVVGDEVEPEFVRSGELDAGEMANDSKQDQVDRQAEANTNVDGSEQETSPGFPSDAKEQGTGQPNDTGANNTSPEPLDSLDKIMKKLDEKVDSDDYEKPIQNLPGNGFRLNKLNLVLGGLNDFTTNSPNIWGGGAELQWQKRHQFLQSGLHIYQIKQPYNFAVQQMKVRYDSTYQTQIESREQLDISSIWVVDSFEFGHFQRDTTITMVIDTTIILRVDTNQFQTNIVNQSERRFYYVELPILYGYQFGNGNWQFQAAAGVALQQAVSYSVGEGQSTSQFGMSALFQPAVTCRFGARWSLLGRAQLRYPMQESVLFEQKNIRYSLQVGVSYHW
jgi:hypothetical protein